MKETSTILKERSPAIAALEKKLLHRVGKAIADFSMIHNGDRIMVCLSGGKDSFVLLTLMQKLKARAPVKFDLVATVLNQRGESFPEKKLASYLEKIGQPYFIIRKPTTDIVRDKLRKGKYACAFCSRLRRGILYTEARALGFTKIALGHHGDDILETFLLNFMYAGSLKAMPPVLVSKDRAHIVIRPLAYCRESEIEAYASEMDYPVVPGTICGLPINPQRKRMKELIQKLEQEIPGVRDTMFASLGRVVPSHLMDRGLYDFTGYLRAVHENE